MSEMWNSVAPGWEANAEFVDDQLALATEALLDAAGIGAGNAVLDLAAGPGGAGLAAAERVGPSGTVVLSDFATEALLDAAGIGAGNAVLDLAAGPGGAGLAAAERVGPSGTVVLSDVAAEM